MIAVLETKPGVFEPIIGNPELTSLDGSVRATMRTLLSPSWTDADRAKFGVHFATSAVVPEGKRPIGKPTYEQRDGAVVQVIECQDVPPPETHELLDLMDTLRVKVHPDSVVITGLAYPVVLVGESIIIACENHTAAEWAAFDDERIAAMDGTKGARFWRNHRAQILKMAGLG
jgi:hypothetical protein